uniref:Uncharacterized protein AlNc14C244G9527 n=1 Tax=Albugo laibachii Nc14 TaxID=890382 RepID=F0WT43_9STRA|nr:hypothetical protein TcasGA2_TC015470 [Albugo laibachii Nc14]|eukprot:CCA24530.1 hypothetical protein TcasGA2_TC015470 [Albugo laibachii Nc14]
MCARTIPLRERIKCKALLRMHVLVVMSPTGRIADVVDSSERATDHIHEEKSEVPKAALVKVLAMLGDFRGATSTSHRILDSGSSRHLVKDLNLLENPVDFNSECLTAASDGDPLRITKQESVVITVKALGIRKTVRLLDVQYAENLERDIISYGKLEQKGSVLEYREGKSVLVSCTGGVAAMDVDLLAKSEHESDLNVQCGTLVELYRRLDHLCYDMIIKMARDPTSGIKLTDNKRESCLACDQGKQTKSVQSNKDTGKNSPIDAIGGVICSYLRVPMTPRDRFGNRYLINFIDHRSNYCRVFLTKTKDAAAMKFKHFLAAFERQFNCRIDVIRTDGVGEYKTLDVFCKTTGGLRQVSEPNNQASNDKAERMHRTIMNMVRSMVFASGLPLNFWGDAAEYAVYILNTSPTKGNIRHVSPIEMLSNMTPALGDIVVFGMPSCRNVATLNDNQNYQLSRFSKGVIDQEELDDMSESRKRDHDIFDQKKNALKGSNRKQNLPSRWTRERYFTRSRCNAKTDTVEDKNIRGVVNAVCDLDPKNYGEATMSQGKHKWMTAVSEELKALGENGWVLKTKTDANGDVERYKARLVTCGNEQLSGVDYTLTFAAVMDLSTVKKDKDELTILGVYVDGLLATGISRDAVDKFFKVISALEIKELGVVNKFLGPRMSLDEEVGYVLDQEVSIDLLQREYGLEKANGVRAPIFEEFNDCNSQEPEYLPVTASNGNASVKDFQSLMVLWFLWSCKKQTGVLLSTMEAEFIAASQAGRELLGLRQLFQELGIKITEPMKMKMDNQAAIKQLESEKSTASAKHGDIRFKFICHYAHAQVCGRGGVLESVSFSGELMTRFVCHRSCALAVFRFTAG